MSKAISLKIKDTIFNETEELVQKTHTPRNSYINEAIKYYNKLIKRKLVKRQYRKESFLLADKSLEINQEFQDIQDDILGLD